MFEILLNTVYINIVYMKEKLKLLFLIINIQKWVSKKKGENLILIIEMLSSLTMKTRFNKYVWPPHLAQACWPLYTTSRPSLAS